MRGVYDTFLVRIVTAFLSYILPWNSWLLGIAVQIAFLCRTPYAHDVVRHARSSIAREGPDDENFTFLAHSTLVLSSYLTTTIVVNNMSAVASYLWLRLPSIGAVSMAIILWWKYIDRPVETFVEEVGKLATFILPPLRYIAWCLWSTTYTVILLVRNFLRSIFMTYFRVKASLGLERVSPEYGEPFTYDGLGPEEIRLLVISTKGPFGDYNCTIRHVSLKKPPSYECISYTWGDAPELADLMVGERKLQVPARVLEIVKSRASSFDRKLVWIDSVCINQTDLSEKAIQIRKMPEIYSSATRTIMWLGNAPGAWACISFLARHMKTFQRNPPGTDWKALFKIGTTEAGWQEFLDFLDHPYWSRMWIVQEIALSKSPIISYGGENLSWGFLEQFFTEMYRRQVGSLFVLTDTKIIPKVLQPAGTRFLPIIMSIRAQMSVDNLRPMRMPQMLNCIQGFQARDPRDKVYGALGLLREKDDQVITADYTKSAMQLCVEVGRHCLKLDPNYTLAHAGIGLARQTSSLPSWCPDYCGELPLATLTLLADDDDVGVDSGMKFAYRASASSQLVLDADSGYLTISVAMINFDSITELGPKCYDSMNTLATDSLKAAAASSESMLAIISFARSSIASSKGREPTPEDDEIVWRALIGDRHRSRAVPAARPATAVFREYCRAAELQAKVTARGPESLTEKQLQQYLARSTPSTFTDFEIGSARYTSAVALAGFGKRVALTANGSLCLVPDFSRVGDAVAIIQGTQPCWILRQETRPMESQLNDSSSDLMEAHWRLVGEAYVHGFMDGEALDGRTEWTSARLW